MTKATPEMLQSSKVPSAHVGIPDIDRTDGDIDSSDDSYGAMLDA